MNLLNKKIVFLLAVVILSFVFVKISPFFEPDAEKIRRIIYSAKTATEKEDLFKCISFVSMDYRDRDENDRPSLFIIGKNVFANYDDIRITIGDLKINILSKAKAVAHLWVSGQGIRTGSDILDIEKVEFEVVFNKEGYRWKVIELKFIQPEDFLRQLRLL